MAFGSSQYGAVGVDLGAQELRLMQLAAVGGRWNVVAARHVPAVTAADPAAAFEANLDAIVELLGSSGFRGRSIITAVPHAVVRVKNLRMPCMPEEDLEQAVRFEALDRFQSLDAEPEIRCFNAGRVETGQGEQLELIVMAVRGDALERMHTAADRAGLSIEAIDFAPAASFRPFERFLKRAEDVDQVNAFLDIGFGGVRLVITQGDNIAFVKQFEAGIASIQSAIAKTLSVPPVEAAALFCTCSGAPAANAEGAPADRPDPRVPAVLAAIEPAIEHLGKEIGLCLRYFSVTFRGQRPDGITCIGGGARHAQLLGRLGEIVGTPVRPGNPLKGVVTEKVFTGADRRTGQPEWATAVGLAMRGIGPVSSAGMRGREGVAS